jgi:LysM repeat protein
MEPNENLKPQPTGGLKLMTVFIAVLALHVVVIGGFTVWHLLYPANVDADMAVDKHKSGKIVSDSAIADMQAPDSTTADKSATDSSTDAPATADASSTAASASTATPAAPATPAPSATTPATASTAASAPAAPSTMDNTTTITVPATPTMVEDTSSAAANPQTASVQHGPVINPPDNLAPPADAPTPGPTAPAASSVATDSSVAPTVEGTPYTVKHGDSLAKIARRHHIALAKLRAANGLASDSLHIGQKLVIPNRASAASASAVAETTTPAAAETAPATSSMPSGPTTASESTAPMAQPVESIDNVSTPAMASTVTPKHSQHTATHHLYTVVKGDTLTKIARRYHTTTSAIVAANNLPNASRLSIGEKLHIPSHESRAAATASEETAPEQTESHSSAKGQLANYVQ